MSWHIIDVSEPDCSLTVKNGWLLCLTKEESKKVPLEDVAAIIVTGFSANIHSQLILQAGAYGISFILCQNFKPASLVLPAGRATDTNLIKGQLTISKDSRQRLWNNTLEAKCLNQASLAGFLAPESANTTKILSFANGRHKNKEPHTAKLYWSILSANLGLGDFRRQRALPGLNSLLNYGYTVLLARCLQRLLAVGLDPTFGIGHAVRERATPLAYDVMEPFRPLIDHRIVQWIKESNKTEVSKPFKAHLLKVLDSVIEYEGRKLNLNNVIEAVCRSLRAAILQHKVPLYKPWTQKSSKWAG